MELSEAILLFVAALLGGALNAVAGGGSFFSFPALLFVGVPPVSANATNTVALWPGNVASAGAYRRELAEAQGYLLALSTVSLVGGLVGALLLIQTSDATFARLVPFLLLVATVIFASSDLLIPRLRAHALIPPGEQNRVGPLAAFIQFLISIYGGFFGGGMGILILAALAFLGDEDIHKMNGLKTLLSALINGIAVIAFVLAGAVRWPEAVIMFGGAIAGGYGGAALARHVERHLVRRFVILVGAALTTYFFINQ